MCGVQDQFAQERRADPRVEDLNAVLGVKALDGLSGVVNGAREVAGNVQAEDGLKFFEAVAVDFFKGFDGWRFGGWQRRVWVFLEKLENLIGGDLTSVLKWVSAEDNSHRNGNRAQACKVVAREFAV